MVPRSGNYAQFLRIHESQYVKHTIFICTCIFSNNLTVDVWSVGCILAELLGGKPFLKGKDYVDQLNKILERLGSPDENTLQMIRQPRAREYVASLPHMPRIPFRHTFPNANPDALDLLERMLTFVPSERITADQALEHKYLSIWHDPADEPACPKLFDFRFEELQEIPDLRVAVYDEVRRFRHDVRAPVQQQQSQQYQQYQQQQMQQQGQPQHYEYQQQANQVPIPDQWDHRQNEDPKPQEFGQSNSQGLERELEYGLDAYGSVRQ